MQYIISYTQSEYNKDKVVLFLLFDIPSWNWLYVFASHSSESQSIQHEYLIMDHSILFA